MLIKLPNCLLYYRTCVGHNADWRCAICRVLQYFPSLAFGTDVTTFQVPVGTRETWYSRQTDLQQYVPSSYVQRLMNGKSTARRGTRKVVTERAEQRKGAVVRAPMEDQRGFGDSRGAHASATVVVVVSEEKAHSSPDQARRNIRRSPRAGRSVSRLFEAQYRSASLCPA